MAKELKRERLDRISDLDDWILRHILSFLPTKEVVGASILSSRWKYLFPLVPNLDFGLYDESFILPLDKMLLLRDDETRVDKFRLKCRAMVHPSRVCGWISGAVWRGVKHLDLNIFVKDFTLPSVLFTCKTLVTLKLCMHKYFALDVPEGVHFPNLKTLHLNEVGFCGDDSVTSLFSGCSNLEDAVMEDCDMRYTDNCRISHHLLKRLTIINITYYLSYAPNNWLVIDIPNPAFFKYSGCGVVMFSSENLQSLVKADIDMPYNHRQADATTFFRAISNVCSLSLSARTLKILILLSREPIPVFANLIELKIYGSYAFIRSISMDIGLKTLLSSSPQLEKLCFIQVVLRYLPENPSLLSKLKVIEISNFEDDEDCIEKVKYILMNGRSLQKLTIRMASYISEVKVFEISEVLLTSPRKSEQCHILIV